MTKRALITGMTGQDGSYLAELLLGKGYEVFGMTRRSSTENLDRIAHLLDRVTLLQGDLLDSTSLVRALHDSQPSEVYNLAAQSFVPTSWNQPVLTGEFTGLGVVRLLDAVRAVDPSIRLYQASSSEMFGRVRETPQTELTPFYPRSPYGVAKVYGHYITMNYRESYDLFACSGILFNHECVTADTPVFVRRGGMMDMLPIEDVVPHRTHPRHGTKYTTNLSDESDLDVWDNAGWTTVRCMTATWNGFEKKANKQVHRIAARGAVYHATTDHVVFAMEKGDIVQREAGEVREGDSLALTGLPAPTDAISMTEDEAWLLGLLAAEGWVSPEGKGRIANQDAELIDQAAACWERVTGGSTSRCVAKSGFEGGGDVIQLNLNGACAYLRYLRESLYSRSGTKRIPKRILNAGRDARMAFLRGFNAGDGLRSTPCTYEFQGFKTSSQVLAAGLYWLAATTLEQRAIICTEQRDERLYFQINLNSPNVVGEKGQHLRRPLEEVVKAEPIEYSGWLFDLATATGTFHAGVGQGWIHNSPRRGLEFVTRKISDGVARIVCGHATTLPMGNLDAARDWGHARDYVEAMWLMLQQDEPDDYVVGTGVAHTVREFAEKAFGVVGLDYRDYITADERFMRPAEVDHLLADPTKAMQKLGWKPRVSFDDLVREMVEADLERVRAHGAAGAQTIGGAQGR